MKEACYSAGLKPAVLLNIKWAESLIISLSHTYNQWRCVCLVIRVNDSGFALVWFKFDIWFELKMVECVNLKLRLEAHTVGYLAGEANAYELEERKYEKKFTDKLSNIKLSNIRVSNIKFNRIRNDLSTLRDNPCTKCYIPWNDNWRNLPVASGSPAQHSLLPPPQYFHLLFSGYSVWIKFSICASISFSI